MFQEKFRCIIADPPWYYRQKGRGASVNHYPLMKTENICALPVNTITTEDAILFLWCTNPQLPEGLKVLSAWGFQYKTKLPWVKLTKKGHIAMGNGMWLRGCCEDILIGVKKKAKPPKPERRKLGILEDFAALEEQRYQHSKKPKTLHLLAETISVGPYLELFAREKTPGWVSWGNEIKEED